MEHGEVVHEEVDGSVLVVEYEDGHIDYQEVSNEKA